MVNYDFYFLSWGKNNIRMQQKPTSLQFMTVSVCKQCRYRLFQRQKKKVSRLPMRLDIISYHCIYLRHHYITDTYICMYVTGLSHNLKQIHLKYACACSDIISSGLQIHKFTHFYSNRIVILICQQIWNWCRYFKLLNKL